jgi:hypothetical protein
LPRDGYLDEWLGNERKIFTVIFLLGSFPVTLYAMVRISLWMVAKSTDKHGTLEQ